MSWRVSRAEPGRGGQPALHEVLVFLEFEGAEQTARIASPEDAKVNKAAADASPTTPGCRPSRGSLRRRRGPGSELSLRIADRQRRGVEY
ncbi:hypothetical protein DL771_001437 [Monosporascus sp. 5C6A]|nr:hypothetical protein DL771_001437 [Monosporascus sp. 5C6A]